MPNLGEQAPQTSVQPMPPPPPPAAGVAAPAVSLPATVPNRAPFIPPQAFEVDAFPAAPHRLRRLLLRGVSGIGILAVVWGLWLLLPTRPAPIEVAPAALPSAAAAIPRSRLADSVEQALRGYYARAQLFENRQMTCDDLANGLVAVDEQWLRYSIARRASPEPFDAPKDNELAARVAAVEREFGASGCPRP